ncbi:unnamed protein product, partial [Polarella glacialis]
SQWPSSSKPSPSGSSRPSPRRPPAPKPSDRQSASEPLESDEAESARKLPVRMISSVDQCNSLVERLLGSSHHSIAVDCEGAKLGRFGKLSLVQLATDDEVYLVDVCTGGPSVVGCLAPLFSDRDLVKVFHDCREDSSVLLHRYGIPLNAVFDTQVGFSAWLERKGLETYQASIAE